MFIDFSFGISLDSTQYPHRLVICVETGLKESCGVFSGRDEGFLNPEEMHRRQPLLSGKSEFPGDSREFFEIVRPRGSRPQTVRRYHYVVIKWVDSYIQYPEAYPLILIDSHNEPWALHLNDMTLRIPDYMWGVPPVQDGW